MIACDIHRESPDVCRYAFYIDGERVKFDDKRVKAYMRENGIKTLADLLRATTSSLPADACVPDNADRVTQANGILTQAYLMKDKDWAALDVKTLMPIVRSIVRMQSADLRTIAGMMVDAALEDKRLIEAD